MTNTYYQKEHINNLTLDQVIAKYNKIGAELYEKDLEARSLEISSDLPETVQDLTLIIKKFFYVFESINDPILVLSAKYFYNTKSSIDIFDSSKHPLNGLYTIKIQQELVNNLQFFQISVNSQILQNFLTNYVFQALPADTSIEAKTQIYKYLFVLAAKEFVEERSFKQDYKYHKINTPTTKNLSILNNQNLYYDINPQYNFFIKKYENTFSETSDIKESIIPNYYAVENYLNTNESQLIKSVVSLNDRVVVTEKNILSNQYYKDYVDVINSLKTSEEKQNVKGVTNYIVDSYFANSQNLNLSSENFPYTTKLTFSNYASDSLIELIQNKNLDTLLVNNIHYIFNSEEQNLISNYPFVVEKEVSIKIPSDEGMYIDYDGKSYVLNTKSKIEEESIPVSVKIESVYSTSSDSGVGFSVYKNKATFNFFSEENRKHLNLLSKPFGIFTYISFYNTINEICSKHLNYNNVLNFIPLDVYPLSFQVEKIFGNDIVANNISIARNQNNAEISLQDTQLYYEKEYNYKVYSMNLINSFKYEFTNINYNFSDNAFTGYIQLQSDCNVYKELIINKKFEVFDNPPTTVDVNIVPFISVPNQLLFLLNTQSTSYFENPIAINQKDKLFFEKIRKKQNLNSTKVLFETVEDLNGVQVFRVKTAPKTYSDFANNLYRFIPIQNNSVTANSFIDTLEQNEKYYYTFRSIDIHNNISNPSEIFEVEIKNNDGAIFPIIQTYNIKNENNFNYTKSFKKYLSINPSILFTSFQKQDDGSILVGNKNDLWKQQFKIRIKSKKSGKAFDLNLRFYKNEQNLIDNTNNLNSDLKFELLSISSFSEIE